MRDSKHTSYIQFNLRTLLVVTFLVALLIAGFVAFRNWSTHQLVITTNSASIRSESDHYDMMDAAKLAARFGDERRAIRELEAEFAEQDVDTRIMRINALINFTSYGDMTSLLIEGLQDENETVRYVSANVLAMNSSTTDARAAFRKAAPHLNTLIKVACEDDATDRAIRHARTAARALKQIAPDFDRELFVILETHLTMLNPARLECDDCPLSEVVEFLSDYSGLKIEIEPGENDLESRLISANESNLTLKSLLELVLPRVEASYRVEGDNIVIYATVGKS